MLSSNKANQDIASLVNNLWKKKDVEWVMKSNWSLSKSNALNKSAINGKLSRIIIDPFVLNIHA